MRPMVLSLHTIPRPTTHRPIPNPWTNIALRPHTSIRPIRRKVHFTPLKLQPMKLLNLATMFQVPPMMLQPQLLLKPVLVLFTRVLNLFINPAPSININTSPQRSTIVILRKTPKRIKPTTQSPLLHLGLGYLSLDPPLLPPAPVFLYPSVKPEIYSYPLNKITPHQWILGRKQSGTRYWQTVQTSLNDQGTTFV